MFIKKALKCIFVFYFYFIPKGQSSLLRFWSVKTLLGSELFSGQTSSVLVMGAWNAGCVISGCVCVLSKYCVLCVTALGLEKGRGTRSPPGVAKLQLPSFLTLGCVDSLTYSFYF